MTDDSRDFYDPEAAQDGPEPGRFVIDSDEKAEWALKKIREAEDEHERLIALVEQERAALDEKKARFDAALERDTAFLKARELPAAFREGDPQKGGRRF